jgi:hypothetical protein
MNSTISRLARVIAIALVITGLLLIRAGQFIWAHRREIRDAAVATYAALRLAAEWAWERRAAVRAAVRAAALAVYTAGGEVRVELEAVSARAAELVHDQPLPALAPIVAPVVALREALQRLVVAIYPAAA